MSTHNELRELVERWLADTSSHSIAVAECADELSALLNRAPAEGWVVVPRQPTEAMRNAAFCALEVDASKTPYRTGTDARDAVYAAMLAAAPAAPAVEVLDPESSNFKEGIAVGIEMEGALSAPAVEVDEAMVERAYETFVEAGWCDDFGVPHPDLMPTLRAALSAALGREGGGNG